MNIGPDRVVGATGRLVSPGGDTDRRGTNFAVSAEGADVWTSVSSTPKAKRQSFHSPNMTVESGMVSFPASARVRPTASG
jgi:hypothetical protein